MGEKKINTWLFMLLATLFNLVLVIGIFIALVVISTLVCNALSLSGTVVLYASLASMVLSFVLSFVIYNKVMKWALKKWNLEEEFTRRR